MNVMVAGMNAFAAQPNLAEKEAQVSKGMTEQDKQEAAVQIGRDLPLILGGILHGVFHHNEEERMEKKRKTQIIMMETMTTRSNTIQGHGKVVLYVNDETTGKGMILEEDISQ